MHGRPRSLLHQPFVDYYYCRRPQTCRLMLARDESDTVVGIVGVETLPAQLGRETVRLGAASNFHAYRPGVGGLLFLHWLRSCDMGLIFGGSPDTHRIIQSQGWQYLAGVDEFTLNRTARRSVDEPPWKRALKQVKRLGHRSITGAVVRARITAEVGRSIRVEEESDYAPDLLPSPSAFDYRLDLDADHLAWRYNTGLGFVRYRLFRILVGDATSGYVVLNELPDRLLVAHCDGRDAAELALGSLLAASKVLDEQPRPRDVVATVTHPVMRQQFALAGLVSGQQRPFALGSVRRADGTLPEATQWLINYDWADNGLRWPFLDQGA